MPGFAAGAALEEWIAVGVEEAAFAGGEVEAVVGAAGVDEAEEGEQGGPGAEALVHGVGVAAGVLAEAEVEAGDAVVGGPGRLAGHEAAVLGV